MPGYIDIEGIRAGFLSFANVLAKVHEWFDDNKENILSSIKLLTRFADWYNAVEKLADKQVVFLDYISEDMIQELQSSDDIDSIVYNYYFNNNSNNFSSLVERCQNAPIMKCNEDFFDEILSAYNIGHYRLACSGLFSIIDGLLSDISEDKTHKIKQRLDEIKEKLNNKMELDQVDGKIIAICISLFDKFDRTVFCDSRFNEDEPEFVNRHWVLHGRTKRQITKLDFLKVLLWIDALALIDNYCENKTD